MTALAPPLPQVHGLTHSHQQAGKVRLHLAEAGAGPVVILLHGWPQHWYMWHELIPVLSTKYRVLCPDLRGFGWSEAPADGYDKETMANDILALADGLGIERFSLAGHDWGGWLGFLLCMLAPERVTRFMPLNILHPFGKVTPSWALSQWRSWYQVVIAAPLLGFTFMTAMSRLGTSPWQGRRTRPRGWTDEETRIYLAQFAAPKRAHAAVQLYRSFLTYDLPRALRGKYRNIGLRTPTLMLYGDEDVVIRPLHLKGWEPYAANMRIEFVHGCGHFIVNEQPELVVERMLAFFGDTGLADTTCRPTRSQR